jgi:hypothetical protein
MATQLIAQARQVKRNHAGRLLDKRNVVGVGVGYKFSQGVNTGQLGLVVSVQRKEPPSALATADMVPTTINGLQTDVLETGLLRAFDLGPRDRWRPVVCPGVSVGHYRITAGTFGCLVQRDDAVFILSNNHVLADVNQGQAGDAILQPGASDGGVMGDHVATLDDYVPIDFGSRPAECTFAENAAQLLNAVAAAFGSSHRLQATKQTPGRNRVDAALARPLSPEMASNEIWGIGAPIGVDEAGLGDPVQKTGRTTAYTQGVITQIDATLRIDYNGQSALFEGQLVADAMSRPGDSGSAVLDMEKRVVGLLFAGSDVATVINPIDEVLSALNVTLAL